MRPLDLQFRINLSYQKNADLSKNLFIYSIIY